MKISEIEFDEVIKESAIPVLLDFWSHNCKACENSNPFIFKLEEVYKDKLRIIKINAEEQISLIKRFVIKKVPTFILFKNRKICFKIEGFQNEIILEKQIRNNL